MVKTALVRTKSQKQMPRARASFYILNYFLFTNQKYCILQCKADQYGRILKLEIVTNMHPLRWSSLLSCDSPCFLRKLRLRLEMGEVNLF